MSDLRLNDPDGARLFRSAVGREHAGLLPLRSEGDLDDSREMTREELGQFWAKLFYRQNTTLEESRKGILHTAWIITRSMAVARGAIDADQPLLDLRICQGWEDRVEPTVEIHDFAMDSVLSLNPPMTCPDVPSLDLDEHGRVRPEYDPMQDEALLVFHAAVQFFVAHMSLDTYEQTKHVLGWFEPEFLRAAWPSPNALLRYEVEIVDAAVPILVKDSNHAARKEIAARWGLDTVMVNQLCALASLALKAQARLSDRDAMKALTIARIDAMIENAKDALDHRGALLMEREKWRIFRDRAEEAEEEDLESMAGALKNASTQRRITASKKP